MTFITNYGIIDLVKTPNRKGEKTMWAEMSYNQYNLTFSEKLETAPDSNEDVFSYYFSEKIIANEYVEKVTKGDLVGT